MPITLDSLREKTGEAKLFDGALNITYRIYPKQTLKDDVARSQATASGPQAEAEYNARLLCNLIVKWDLIGEDGNVVPLTPDAIMETIPTNLLTEILNAIGEDRRLGKKK